jgi:hypothetical protein
MLDFDTLWDYNHPEETERKFISLLTQAENSGNIGYIAELLTQVARSRDYRQKSKSDRKDVYNNVILDDSAVCFVVELKDDINYSVSEYQKPGYIQLKLFDTEKKEKTHEVFYVRSQEMELGEMLGMLDEQYSQDESSVIKTKNGKYIVALGGFESRNEAEELLRKLSAREDYNEPLHVDSWMSNENPQ